MKRYLKFAASFWMGAFLVAGSFASAQITPAARTKKKSAGTAANTPVANSSDSGIAPSAGIAASSTATPTADAETAAGATVAAHDQPAGTTTAAPRTMTTPDKRTVIIPQI